MVLVGVVVMGFGDVGGDSDGGANSVYGVVDGWVIGW